MQSNNEIIIACAGGRKTTYIVEQAIKEKTDKKIFVTTYTRENTAQIQEMFFLKGGIPSHIRVDSWYTFLLQEFVRPYQNLLIPDIHIRSIDFNSAPPRYVARDSKPRSYYLNKNSDIYCDRVSDFAYHCNMRTNGMVINRLERIYSHLFIDEMQDLSGWDLNLFNEVFNSSIIITFVGDPRQKTYKTTNSLKNKGNPIDNWADKNQDNGWCVIKEWTKCYRSNQAICDFADSIYPEYPKTISQNKEETGHDGIFYIRSKEVNKYFDEYNPVILRWNITSNTMRLPAINIGVSKGRTYDRVLIFPTEPMKKFIKTHDPSQVGDKSKLYVAVTRAKYSVAFVID